ncbi:MAG TPA: hypothetical protein VN851_27180 [Thermoanaerobaculia bacterium]|nr:hypothetical protein [Thermoanaerobaculia bacterium]
MPDALQELVRNIATWPIAALCLFLFLLLNLGFEARKQAFGGIKSLDARLWYSPDEARDFLKQLDGRNQRQTYAVTELTLDLAFPCVYWALFSVFLFQLYSPAYSRLLLLIPFGAAVCDLGENVTAAYLAWSFDGTASPLATLGAMFTATKTVLFVVALLLIAFGSVSALLHRS